MLSHPIAALDLEPIKIKLMDADEGPGWSQEKAEAVEVSYKQFLALSGKYPERSIVPTKDIDMFWHYHILDTRKYAADCQRIFGYFLHHFPYFGMRGEEDARNLQAAFNETLVLVQEQYGQSWGSARAPKCESGSCDGGASCGSGQCSQGNCSNGVDSNTRPSYANMGLTPLIAAAPM